MPIDRDQLELAVELLRDVGDYAEDTVVEETLDADQPLGRLIAHVLDPDTVRRPARRTPRPSSSGRRWRPSWSRGCGPSSHTAAMTFSRARSLHPYDPVNEPHHAFRRRPRRPAALRNPRRGPLLLVIGSPMASAEFAPLADALASDHTVVTYDPRGYAASTVDDPDAPSQRRAARRRRRRDPRRPAAPSPPTCSAPAAAP